MRGNTVRKQTPNLDVTLYEYEPLDSLVVVSEFVLFRW